MQDVADALLAGLVLERRGPTGRAYAMVGYRLRKARRALGISPPRKPSVARYRPHAGPPTDSARGAPTDQTER